MSPTQCPCPLPAQDPAPSWSPWPLSCGVDPGSLVRTQPWRKSRKPPAQQPPAQRPSAQRRSALQPASESWFELLLTRMCTGHHPNAGGWGHGAEVPRPSEGCSWSQLRDPSQAREGSGGSLGCLPWLIPEQRWKSTGTRRRQWVWAGGTHSGKEVRASGFWCNPAQKHVDLTEILSPCVKSGSLGSLTAGGGAEGWEWARDPLPCLS